VAQEGTFSKNTLWAMSRANRAKNGLCGPSTVVGLIGRVRVNAEVVIQPLHKARVRVIGRLPGGGIIGGKPAWIAPRQAP